jgi:hypothetical protein
MLRPAAGRSLPVHALLGSALLCLSATMGCDGGYPTTPAEPSLVVHGMLRAGSEDQRILLEYTRRIEEGFFRGLTPASGARITVRGATTHEFNEDPARPGVYFASFAPPPGQRYTLRIDGPAGETVVGETVVPHAPLLILPARDTTISLGMALTITWSSSPAAAAYIITDRPAGEPTHFLSLLHPPMRADTSFTTTPGAFGRNDFHYRVTAVDSNYVHYKSVPGTGERSLIRLTVDGAYGLFGSYAQSELRRVTVR